MDSRDGWKQAIVLGVTTSTAIQASRLVDGWIAVGRSGTMANILLTSAFAILVALVANWVCTLFMSPGATGSTTDIP